MQLGGGTTKFQGGENTALKPGKAAGGANEYETTLRWPNILEALTFQNDASGLHLTPCIPEQTLMHATACTYS